MPKARVGLPAGGRVALLHHRGQGVPHLDVVMSAGPRCPTLKLWRQEGRWRWSWQPVHRRRYLAWQGPISGGRGQVAQLLVGRYWWDGEVLCLQSAAMKKPLRLILGRHGVVRGCPFGHSSPHA